MDDQSYSNVASGTAGGSWIRNSFPNWFPIFGSHVKRIGLFRTAIGGFPMYISIPFFLLFHVFCLYLFFHCILQPLLGLKKIYFKNHLVIDRHKVKGLPWFDRFNCMYCGYANGLATYFEISLLQVEEWNGQLSAADKLILVLGLLVYFPISIVFQIQRLIVYDLLISHPLGLHRLSSEVATRILSREGNSDMYRGFLGKILLNEKLFSLKLNNGLEQIETAWCPIRHYDKRSSAVYPKHHGGFLEPHEVEKMKSILQTDGTVSMRKPYR